MTPAARERLAACLGEIGARGSFSARRSAPVDDLRLEVRGLGLLDFPVPKAQAGELCRIGRPARFGLGELTLTDRGVRDTWEIPKSRVRLDKRRWDRTLKPVLAKLGADLGLPAGRELKAELHSMLVYERGQFFAPHQDSEKADDMVGTLVVTLPSALSGGALVVEHGGRRATYRAPRTALSLVAFYADCRHQIQSVRSGHRIVLTYNLLLSGEQAGQAAAVTPPATLDSLAGWLEEHFGEPGTSEAPSRLVYLLDHEYTERGLGWSRLKGADAPRAAALREAAQRCNCEVVLALADVHEVWSCYEPDRGWGGRRYGRRRSWRDDYDDDDPWADGEGPTDPDEYELEELVDWGVTLDGWRDPEGQPGPPLATAARDPEVCATTPTTELRPYSSEYEGYMGNYGNTMDRWYHRGAVVVWPRWRDFAVRAEGSPSWALKELRTVRRAGDLTGARERAAMLAPFWRVVARQEPHAVFAQALRAGRDLDDPALAAMLAEPFELERLAPTHAQPAAALVDSYGEDWAAALFATWSARPHAFRPQSAVPARADWVAALPSLCEALAGAGKGGATTATLLLGEAWRWLAGALAQVRSLMPPSRREAELAGLAGPVLGVLRGAAQGANDDLRDEVIAVLCEDADELLACSMEVVRRAAGQAGGWPAAAGVDVLARHCSRQLEARVSRPRRAEGDWSMELVGGCGCRVCGVLREFLADPERKAFDWPLATDGRRHVHSMIDRAELPVVHETRRKGRPYTLVLTKTDALFEREAGQRRRDEANLKLLRARAGMPSRKNP